MKTLDWSCVKLFKSNRLAALATWKPQHGQAVGENEIASHKHEKDTR
jgi:hypothetical protein